MPFRLDKKYSIVLFILSIFPHYLACMSNDLTLKFAQLEVDLNILVDTLEELRVPEYTVNLMWINRKLDEDQRYIYPAVNEKELHKKFLDNIFKWAAASTGGQIHVWFDSALTPSKAIFNTKKLIENYVKDHPELAPIKLKDVRELSEVRRNPEVFSSKTPVYFRVDLLRVIASYEMILNGRTTYFVYGDIDMKPLSRQELFDAETQENLNRFGIVMARGGHLGFENGFFIVGYNANLLKAIKWALIDLNIVRAYNALKGDFYDVNRCQPRGPMVPLQQIVYDSYPAMFKYFYSLEGYGELRVQRLNVIYDENIHGFHPFGDKYLLNYFEFISKTDEFEERVLGRIKVPTKKVKLPPAGHQYD